MMYLTPGRFLFALLIVAVAVILQAPEAFAIGDDVAVGNYSCAGGTASGQLFVSGTTCPTALTMDNVFSFLVCNFEQLSSNIMGAMYCGMVQHLAPSVEAAITFATVIYGIMFMFGMIPATGKEAMKFLIKCGLILSFATNADFLIGIAYRGALAAISSGASIAVGLMSSDVMTNGSTIGSGADVYTQLDSFLATLFHNATDYLGGTTNAEMCKNAIFAVLGTMFVIFPLFAYMGILLVGRIIMTFFRAVFAYIYAVVAITFILLLAPFFLVFALFKLTNILFERWLGYLVSFALQVVLLFSFLAFVFSLHLEKNQVVTNLTSVIMYNSQQAETSSFRIPFAYCTLCDFNVVNADTNAPIKDTDPDYIAKGKLVCKSPQVPIKPTFATSPDSTDQIGSLLSFAGNGILSLIVLAMLIEHLLKLIPSLAQKLASSMNAIYATQLGGGESYYTKDNALQIPGQSLISDATAGFNRGFESRMRENSISATAQGLKDSLYGLATGKTSSGRALYNNSTEPGDSAGAGLPGAFTRWLTDPGKFGQ